MMVVFAALTLALAGPVEANPQPGKAPLALLLSLEVEDMDRDIARQHEIALASRQRLSQAQRAAQRGIASTDEVEQEAADSRFQAARETEMAAVRALKAYQRDVLGGDAKADLDGEYALVLGVLASQEATARVEAAFRAFKFKQAQALSRRGAISKAERDAAEVEAGNAQAAVALMKTRQARLAWEQARGPVRKPADRAEVRRLERAYLRLSADHAAIVAEVARARFEQARDRARPGATPAELEPLQKARDAALAALDADRKRLDDLGPDSAPPPALPTP